MGREPGAIETALAMALWNEHCSYRSSRIHLKTLQFPTSKKVSAAGENAGVVDLGRGEAAAFKMESHNHPSHIMPYHGAATGVGGILRDIFAMGARPVALADYLCFGPPGMPEGRARVDGVVRGIGGYGNCIGVPTITGHTEFAACYEGNILVNAMALGLLKSGSAISSKAEGPGNQPGNYVVYGGAATGRDGILGASMASASFGHSPSKGQNPSNRQPPRSGESPSKKPARKNLSASPLPKGGASGNPASEEASARPAVQIGDPFFGKQLMEASLEAMEAGLIAACQDMGAAGLSCSSFEMASKGGRGFRLHLDRTPLRDPSMSPEEILLSESQERMLFICRPADWEPLKKIFSRRDLELEILGKILPEKDMELFWRGRRILKADPSLFTDQAPVERRPLRRPKPAPRTLPQNFRQKAALRDQGGGGHKKNLLNILGSAEGRSRSFIYRQYDQRVGANTVWDSSRPIGVLRLPESQRELAFALGGRNHIMEADVEQGALDAALRPALQLSLRGFSPWAVTDCLNFGSPEKPSVMGEFALCVESLSKACAALDAPVISGNVSFYNESAGRGISPSPAVAMIGLKEKPLPLAPPGFARRGERVWLLCSHQFWLPCFDGRPRGACLDGRPSGRSRTAAEAQAFSESQPRGAGLLGRPSGRSRTAAEAQAFSESQPRSACLDGRPSGRSRTAAEAQAFSESQPRGAGLLGRPSGRSRTAAEAQAFSESQPRGAGLLGRPSGRSRTAAEAQAFSESQPRGAGLLGRPSGRSRTAAEAQAFSESQPRSAGLLGRPSGRCFGALSPKLCRLFFDSLRALSGGLSAARAVGKFGLPFALAQMVLEKGAGFRLDPKFPLPLWEERLYEAIVCLPPSKEKGFRQKAERLGLEAVFLGETTETSDLVLRESRMSFQEMSREYYSPWEKDLSL